MPQTEAPPALANRPQFTPEYWIKVPRETVKAVIERVTNRGDNVEIVLKGGLAFQRPRSDIQQLLTANTEVEVEAIGKGQIITGLFVKGVGWAFRMTADDLAEYAKNLALREHEKQMQIAQRMVEHVADQLEVTLADLGLEFADDDTRREAAVNLAAAAIYALQTGP